MVFETRLDAAGHAIGSRVHRARIHSRMQLDFDRVLALLEGGAGHGIDDDAVADSLRSLETLGELRLADAVRRNAVAHRSGEVRVKVGDDPSMGFIAIERMRNRVELYNEQLSLLCNTEGAAMLQEHGGAVQPIFRTHDPPEEERLEELARRIDAIVADRGLEPRFAWGRGKQSLGDYLRGLPPELPLTEAIARQAIMVNVRSQFSAEPGRTSGSERTYTRDSRHRCGRSWASSCTRRCGSCAA